MPAPWLTVVMPVHGGAQFLAATLASAITALPEGVEFLIYDSSSDDACGEIVAAHARDLDVQYKAMPEMRGWPDKTNLAVAEASAPHVAILHQDDLWLPGHIEAARRSIAQYPDAVMSVAPSRLVNGRGRDIGQWSVPLTPGARPGMAFGRALIVQNFLAIPAPVIRRDAWTTAGGMDPSLWYTADWDLYLKLAKLGGIVIRPRATTAFRIHGGSLTMTGSRDAEALHGQLDTVLQRHGNAFGLEQDGRLRARALASAAINCGLAQGAAGRSSWMWPTLSRFLRLGPVDALRYVHESRIVDRVLPRLRARMAGNL